MNSFLLIWKMCMLLIGGYASDKMNDYLMLMKLACLLLFVSSFVCYYIMDEHMTLWPLIVNDLITGVALGLFGGAMELFMVDSVSDVVTRYTVIGIAYNVCQALFGGTAPLIGSALSLFEFYYVGAYLSASALVSLLMLQYVSYHRKVEHCKDKNDSVMKEIVVVTPDAYA